MVASEMYQEQEEIFELGDFRCYVAKKKTRWYKSLSTGGVWLSERTLKKCSPSTSESPD